MSRESEIPVNIRVLVQTPVNFSFYYTSQMLRYTDIKCNRQLRFRKNFTIAPFDERK